MKSKLKFNIVIISIVLLIFSLMGFSNSAPISKNAMSKALEDNVKLIFLHHSTGNCIWEGGVSSWITQYNSSKGKNYQITQLAFPKSSPYGWANYPYDYWNIWVNHAGSQPYMEEPTLEILTQQYDIVIFKHCFPVASISADVGTPNIASSTKRIENYKLQYDSLKTKMKTFPNNRFIVWTGAALVQGGTNEASAIRTREFFNWVKNNWDEKGDNIFLWDFYELETEGTLYLKNEYANSTTDSHPNKTFSQTVAPYFSRRIVDVIEGRGDTADIMGKSGTTGTGSENPEQAINDFRLYQNYPNPFNPETTIEFQIPKPSFTTLKIYNTIGQLNRTLLSEDLSQGIKSIVWDRRNDLGCPVSSGIYIYCLRSGNLSDAKKMLFMK